MIEVEFRKWITRGQVRAEPDHLFIFGDNLERSGLGGQAKEMRGERNAFGIPTKRSPSMEPNAFFSDAPDEMLAVNAAFARISNWLLPTSRYSRIVWPMDGIGTGLAKLQLHSPYIYDMIQTYESWLRKFIKEV